MRTAPMFFQKQTELNKATDFLRLRNFDQDILEAIKAINASNELATHQSCSGHPEEDLGQRDYYLQMLFTEKGLDKLLLMYKALSFTYPQPNMVRLSFVRKRFSMKDHRETTTAVITVNRTLGERPSTLAINRVIIRALAVSEKE